MSSSNRSFDDTFTGLEIAIIGMSGRFPDAPDLETFWRNLAAGRESIHAFTAEELAAEGLDPALYQKPNYVPAKGDVEDAEAFDAEFFGFSPREAQITDPQQRLFLEHAWHALEDAGYDPARFEGLIGVYAGASMNRYQLDLHADPEVMAGADSYQLMLGNDKDFLTTRVSYKLGLEGPSVAVQTACSTSLVAVHMAVQALNSGECDLALAGGASVRLPRKEGYLYREGMILSPDGHCRAFDADAAGTVEGNGLGIVTLKRLEDALSDGDHIRAVIKGSAINNDGSQKVGFTAPRVQGQARAIRAAQMMAEVPAESIRYVEAHGTATPLGDSIEIAALTRAFRATTEATDFCALGSVKTNIGHLDAAAGVAGLIKTVLALEAGQIPPSLHFNEPPEGIDFASSPFFVNTELRPWKSEGPRRAGVSSFGIGGTNAHVILEEAPKPAIPRAAERSRVLVFSGRSSEAVKAQGLQLAEHLERHPDLALADVAFTLERGRQAFEYRRALVCSSLGAAQTGLRDGLFVEGQAKDRAVAFLFPGQGSQYLGMGRNLRQTQPAFTQAFDRCRKILRPLLGVDVLDLLEEEIHETSLAQPYLLALEVSLAKMWQSWGIEPRALLGHSLGELSAACVAGVLRLEDALDLVVLRGRLMQEQSPGAMTSVPLNEEQLKPFLGAGLTIAALNGDERSVVSGSFDAITDLETRLAADGLTCKRLRTSHAFHSPTMEPVAEALKERLQNLELQAPQIPFVSNLTGTWITPDQATDPQYWAEQMLSPVRFADGLAKLAAEDDLALLEVGPGRQLTGLARRHPAIAQGCTLASSLGGIEEADLEVERVLTAVAKLWTSGVAIDGQALTGIETGRRVPLPVYPFERQNYGVKRRADSVEKHLASNQPLPLTISSSASEPAHGEGFSYLPTWRQAPPLSHSETETGPWLILVDALGVGEELAARLQKDGAKVHLAWPGEGFEKLDEGRFRVDPEDFGPLLETLREPPTRIVHAWTLADDAALSSDERLELAETLGFRSLVHLARALAQLPSEDRHLSILTSHMQRIVGEEVTAPEKAILLGPSLVIPQEFPALTSQVLDIAWEGLPLDREGPMDLGPAQLDQILAELQTEDPPPLVALRDSVRWLREFEPLVEDLGIEINSTVQSDGTYLITGGLGEMGLTFAEWLAEQGAQHLTLLSRSGLDDTTAAREVQFLDETLPTLAAEVASEIDLTRLGDFPGLEDGLRQLSACYARDYLHSSGLDLTMPQSSDAMRQALGVIPDYQRFFDYLLGLLAKASGLRRNADTVQLASSDLPTTHELKGQLEARYPEFGGLFELLHHCASQFGPALSGEIPGIGVLYPNGEATLLEETGERTLAYGHRQLYAALLGEIIARRAAEEPERTFRVLEVGGGTGILTGSVLDRLRSRNLEHFFTDIGPAFVAKAKAEAERKGLDFLRFATLDISHDPIAQGFAAESFDFVIGLDVVHAAPSIPGAVDHLKKLLKPGGEMLLVERVEPYPWVQLIWGLAKDWWIFADDQREDQPLIPTRVWREIFEASGFNEVFCLDRDEIQDESSGGSDYALLAGRKAVSPSTRDADGRLAQRRERVDAIARLGAEVRIVQADVSDRSAMNTVLNEVRSEHGPIRGVIHAAGVLGMGMIQRKQLDDTRAVLAPKVQGTLILDDLLRDEPLDFFLLCSSLSGLAGNVGQVDYCAANAFLDAYAHSARRPARSGKGGRRRPLPVTSIDWGRWSEAGMAVDAMTPLPSLQRVAHPLLQSVLSESESRIVFRAELKASDCWVLNEHRLVGRPVMPGTAYLEMARAALEAWQSPGDDQGVELSKVLFWTPLVQPNEEATEIFTVLEKVGDGCTFEVLSLARKEASPRLIRHANGQVRTLSESWQESGQRDDQAGIMARVTELKKHQPMQPADFEGFGRRWQVLKQYHFGDGEALGKLELDADFEADRETFKLHPSLLDAATSFAAGHLMSAFQFPLSYDRICLWAPLEREFNSLARWQHDEGQLADGQRTFSTDLTLVDSNGRVLVEVAGFTKRGIDMEQHRASQEEGLASEEQLLQIPESALLPLSALPEWTAKKAEPSEGLTSSQGKAILACLLAQQGWSRRGLAQVAVSAHPLGSARGTPAPPPTQDAQNDPPRLTNGSLDEALSQVWMDVLGLDQIAPGDNFFELGGDSILALQLVTRAKEVGIELNPGLIFQHQTVAGLARALSGSDEPTEKAPDMGEEMKAVEPAAELETAPWKDFPLANLDAHSFGQVADQLSAFDDLDEEA